MLVTLTKIVKKGNIFNYKILPRSLEHCTGCVCVCAILRKKSILSILFQFLIYLAVNFEDLQVLSMNDPNLIGQN